MSRSKILPIAVLALAWIGYVVAGFESYRAAAYGIDAFFPIAIVGFYGTFIAWLICAKFVASRRNNELSSERKYGHVIYAILAFGVLMLVVQSMFGMYLEIRKYGNIQNISVYLIILSISFISTLLLAVNVSGEISKAARASSAGISSNPLFVLLSIIYLIFGFPVMLRWIMSSGSKDPV